VSWINIRSAGRVNVAVFSVALLLPFSDPSLPLEFAGETRFWPDQTRVLRRDPPIEEQIVELQMARLLGELDPVYLGEVENEAYALWIIETHAGSPEERSAWLRSVIAMEGRRPW
jgi:hypothetical protein